MDAFQAFWDPKKGLQPLFQTGRQKMRKMLQSIFVYNLHFESCESYQNVLIGDLYQNIGNS